VTDSPSEPTAEVVQDGEVDETPAAGEGLEGLAAELGALVGADSTTAEHDTVRLVVARESWSDAVAALVERLPFFSWLSAVDWSRDVEVGEPADEVEQLEERFEVLARFSSVTDADAAILVTVVPKSNPVIDSVAAAIPGAAWHEREAAEMFGIDFRGHPNLTKLYLPDSFEGYPLLKSYPLLAREVKPWPGTVDVEDMPSTENVEAAAVEAAGEQVP
jgi:NADH-quinone oxidoreductase subunit C